MSDAISCCGFSETSPLTGFKTFYRILLSINSTSSQSFCSIGLISPVSFIDMHDSLAKSNAVASAANGYACKKRDDWL